MKRTRTRYAPSPTGYLHIGGARTALFAYLYAKHFNGDFIVRIEDTDIARNISDGEKSQLENLEWLGIIPDESPINPVAKYGPYRQSENLIRYNELINQLLEVGKAYKAYDSTDELTKQRDEQESIGVASFRYHKNWLKISEEETKRRDTAGEYTIRLSLKKDKWYEWKDIVRGKIAVNTNDIGDFVIKKTDGYPTYNFAAVVDDHDMEISDVHRGEEHITNTPKQLALYDAFGWEAPKFAHFTIITNMEGKKLSKRDTHMKQFISDYKNSGYNPHAIVNFLALLGWTHKDAREILSKEELIKDFDPTRLSRSPSKFDIKKMDWFSKEYIKKMDNNELLKFVHISHDSEWTEMFLNTYKQSAVTYLDLENNLKIYDDTSVKKIEHSKVVSVFAKELNKKEFTSENIQESINLVKDICNVKGKDLFMPIRLETTYQEHGPELAKAIYLFGEELIKERLK
ncbi:glutamate--tRNA ligase [Candidatus Mycoplasma mahonii]|uniref:glutamate--tRNA ligase n=1 Tax=Candidatus Mycoplasma mahonii TaxID=3004105 RepID=UPI0026EA62F3|nr:glutamate--tRNA ligase [Candidatus Mycoplasma mahonii]WKX02491.1 glutamate--tRNA ligase [Candidatus Mycoplasma mahonii]